VQLRATAIRLKDDGKSIDDCERRHWGLFKAILDFICANQIMEHIAQATGSPHLPIRVPYLVTKRFENVIFDHENVSAQWAYTDPFERCLEVSLDDSSPPEMLSAAHDILDFYQARCFFGLLQDMYSIAGIELNIESYLDRQNDHRPLVTTRSLLTELNDLANQAHNLTDESKTQKYLEIDECIQSTEELTLLLQISVAEDSKHHQRWEVESNATRLNDLWTMQITVESTAMLRETILSAARQIYMPSVISSELASRMSRELPRAPENIFCMERFKVAGWCPRQALEAAQTTLKSRSVLFALSSIDRRDTKQLHSSCSTDECKYDNVDNDTYQTQHAPDCGGRSCPLVPREYGGSGSSASAIISRCVLDNCIPVINLAEQPNHKPFLSIKPYQPIQLSAARKRRRRASDPWSSEARCEKVVDLSILDSEDAIQRGPTPLQNSETGLPHVPYIAISHVWSQGLGNRRTNAIYLCQLRRLQHFVNLIVPPQCRPIPFWIDTICVPLSPGPREVAIKSMRTVYRDAIAVLVVDSTLTELLGTMGNQELLLRIKAAPWVQRLWTYHEACLARDLYFQIGGSDKAAVWSQTLLIEDSGPNGDGSGSSLDVKAAATATPNAGSNLLSKQAHLSHKNPLLEYVAAYLLMESASLQLFSSSGPQDFRDLRYLSRQLALRTTSRLADEAVCLSTLLGLLPADVMTAPHGRSVSEEDRMKRLWELLPAEQLPAEILFCNRPFYEETGCGWMPKSLLRNQTGNQVEHLGCGMVIGKHPEYGILVKMEGIAFEVPAEQGLENDASLTGKNEGSSLSDVVLALAGRNYKISKVKSSEAIPSSRSSVGTGTFAILMPQSEMQALFQEVEDEMEDGDSHTTELPFGVLVNVLERPSCLVEELDRDGEKDTIFVARREMVELEPLLEDVEEEQSEPESDCEGLLEETMSSVAGTLDVYEPKEEGRGYVLVEAKIVPVTQKWFVG
jgi:hypothetical protein